MVRTNDLTEGWPSYPAVAAEGCFVACSEGGTTQKGRKRGRGNEIISTVFFSPSHLHSLALAFISVDKLIIYHMLLSFPVQTARSSLFVMAAKSVAHGSWLCSHDGL